MCRNWSVNRAPCAARACVCVYEMHKSQLESIAWGPQAAPGRAGREPRRAPLKNVQSRKAPARAPLRRTSARTRALSDRRRRGARRGRQPHGAVDCHGSAPERPSAAAPARGLLRPPGRQPPTACCQANTSHAASPPAATTAARPAPSALGRCRPAPPHLLLPRLPPPHLLAAAAAAASTAAPMQEPSAWARNSMSGATLRTSRPWWAAAEGVCLGGGGMKRGGVGRWWSRANLRRV